MKVEQHPDKTFIGRVERGFDFLGYYLKPGVLKVSRGTFERFTERISQLYEQGAGFERIGEYVKHWLRWGRAGVRYYSIWQLRERAQGKLHTCAPSVYVISLDASSQRSGF